MITFKQKGDFKKLDTYLQRVKQVVKLSDLDKYGKAGVAALSSATPVDTGLTANSWVYEIERGDGYVAIHFNNTNVIKDYCNVAIMLQYGHGTGTGGWVTGRDYINPAIQPIFDQIAKGAWEEVISK